MITVRFPNGQAVQYNDANYLSRKSEFTDIRDKKGGRLIAQAPNSCLIERVEPSNVYNPLLDFSQYSIGNVERELRSIKTELRQIRKTNGAKRK